MEQIPQVKILSVIPMRTQLVFPNTSAMFDVGRGLSLAAVERAAMNDGYVFLTKQKDPLKEDPAADDLYTVGTVAPTKKATNSASRPVRGVHLYSVLATGLSTLCENLTPRPARGSEGARCST